MDFEWLARTLYGRFGSEHPTLSIVLASLVGAIVFGGLWWVLGQEARGYLKVLPPPEDSETLPSLSGGRWEQESLTVEYEVMLTNDGGPPVTVLSATASMSAPSADGSVGQYTIAVLNTANPTQPVSVAAGQLPAKLEPGTAHPLRLGCSFEIPGDWSFANSWYRGSIRLQLRTTGGDFVRDVPFHLSGANLNRVLRPTSSGARPPTPKAR